MSKMLTCRLFRKAGATKLYVKTEGWEEMLKGLPGMDDEGRCSPRSSWKLDEPNCEDLTLEQGFAHWRFTSSGQVLVGIASRQRVHDATREWTYTGTTDMARGLAQGDYLSYFPLFLLGTSKGVTITLKDSMADTTARLYVESLVKYVQLAYDELMRDFAFFGEVTVAVALESVRGPAAAAQSGADPSATPAEV